MSYQDRIFTIVDGFVLREIAGTWVVIPAGAKVVDFSGIINLSESGALLWQALEKGATVSDLVEKIASEYDVDSAEALEDVNNFLDSMTAQELVR